MSLSILVTGGAGYIGSVLVPYLLDEGHSVTVLDSFMYGGNTLSGCCAFPEFNVVRGDVRDVSTVTPLLDDADVVIPLAAIVGAPACDLDPARATATNLIAPLLMLEHMSKDQRVLVPITNSAYGSGEVGGHCTEESPLRPVSGYASDKVDLERHIMDSGNAISFRLATVFGMSPRMRLDLLVNDFVHRAVTDRVIALFEPNARRNFIHVRDVARAFIHGLTNFDTMKDNVYNVGLSDANMSKAELCDRIRQHVPDLAVTVAENRKDPDQRNYVVSNAKIEATGYCPQHSLDDGIVELLKGYRTIRNNRYGNV